MNKSDAAWPYLDMGTNVTISACAPIPGSILKISRSSSLLVHFSKIFSERSFCSDILVLKDHERNLLGLGVMGEGWAWCLQSVHALSFVSHRKRM